MSREESRDAPFSRAAVLVTAFKRMPNGRTIPVRGSFNRVRTSDLAFRPGDVSSPIAGQLEIDLSSLATDAPERDDNVVTHLFGALRTVTASIAPSAQMLAIDGEGGWTWRGFVEVLGGRIPVVLALRDGASPIVSR